MICSFCGSDTRVVATKHEQGGRRTARVRVCKDHESHRFTTVERPVALTIHEVLVRRSGDHRLAPGEFDLARLCRDVSNGVLRRLDEAHVQEVVKHAIRDLESVLASIAHPLTDDEQRQRPGFRYAVLDTDIGMAVLRRLRSRNNRMPHVLYALSTFGRSNREGRSGFHDAGDVLRWMAHRDNYPDLGRLPLPQSAAASVIEWVPRHPGAAEPRLVIKRDLSRRRQFGHEQFMASIRRAMIGRPNADRLSAWVVRWVLDDLAGQREVLSSQLASGVLSCLRCVDDIAYLRWAAVAKNMSSVTDFRDEAVALLTDPSPQLRFPATDFVPTSLRAVGGSRQ